MVGVGLSHKISKLYMYAYGYNFTKCNRKYKDTTKWMFPNTFAMKVEGKTKGLDYTKIVIFNGLKCVIFFLNNLNACHNLII